MDNPPYSFRDVALFVAVLALSVVAIYLLKPSAVGLVVLEPLQPNGTTFTTPGFSVTCHAEATDPLVNLTATLTDDIGRTFSSTIAVNDTNVSEDFLFSDMNNGDYALLCKACDASACYTGVPGSIVISYTVTAAQQAPVINLTFDDPANPWKDYSNLNHQFTKQGGAGWVDYSSCKWYGCVDLTDNDATDYLDSNLAFTGDSLAVSYWVYFTEQPSGSNSQGFWHIGTTGDRKKTSYSTYCFNPGWMAHDGEVSTNTYSSGCVGTERWYYVFEQYNAETGVFEFWINDDYYKNWVLDKGPLTDHLGSIIILGKSSSSDLAGYLDEFLMWDRANFTSEEVQGMYEEKRLGTPPEFDLVLKSVKYTLPYDWASPMNTLDTSGSMPITITVSNEGASDTPSAVDVVLVLDGSSVCTFSVSLDAHEEQNLTCSWPKAQGFHQGYALIDSGDDIDEESYVAGSEDNNRFEVFIPFEDHPRFRFTDDMWTDIESWFKNPSHEVSYQSYSTYSSFVSEDFNPSWSVNSVDPRGKKGFENALNCYINDFAPSTACTRAMNHLQGWLVTVSGWDSGSVQAMHELIHVAATYDLMFPSLTEEQAMLYAERLQDICLEVYGMDNVRPDKDPGYPDPGNGKGFGTGLSGPCFVALGDYSENPSMFWSDPQGLGGKSTIAEWDARVERYLKGFKADAENYYQEGMLYNWYSKYHLVDMLWYMKLSGMNNLSSEYNDVICGWTKEAARFLLDHSYSGSDLRGDENRHWRQVSFGDTNSYEAIGSDGLNGWDVISAFGLLCDDPELKSVARTLRYYAYQTNEQTRSPGGLYYYSLLSQEAPLLSDIGDVLPPFSFATAMDRFSLRRGFSYVNDSLFIFDAGDERGSGHPNAEFDLFVYVFGEPFLDYPQVPYEDDVRSEVWHNTISFSQSDVQGYTQDPEDAPLHQYYGNLDLTPVGSYPDFNYMPDQYRGDVLNTIGTPDGSYAALHAYKPYKTATVPVVQDVVIFDDLIAQADFVKRNTGGLIYHNWLNIYSEFPSTMSGDVLTFTRAGTNKHYVIDALWSSAGGVALSGGDSGKQYCFQKTSCSGGKGNYGKYYHAVQGPIATTVFAHHWYVGEPKATLALYNGSDKGLTATYSDHVTQVVFDTDEDGLIDELAFQADGWSLAVKDSVVAVTGATSLQGVQGELFSSSKPASVYLDQSPGLINATVGLDDSASVSFLITTAGFTLLVDGQSHVFSRAGNVVSFSLEKGVHQVEFILSGDSSPVVSASVPGHNAVFFSSEGSSSVSFACVAADDGSLTAVSLVLEGSTAASASPGASSYTLSHQQSFSDGAYEWYCTATDDAAHSSSSAPRSFSVTPPVEPPPPGPQPPSAASFNGATTDFGSLPDYDDVVDVTLERTGYGRIVFLQPVSSVAGVNFDTVVSISSLRISLDPSSYPQLDLPARLSFYNVPYSQPVLRRDGSSCASCADVVLDGDDLSVTVDGFSVYTVVDGSSPPPPADDSPPKSGGGGGSSSYSPPVVEGPAVNVSENVSVVEEPVEVLVDEEPASAPVLESPASLPSREPAPPPVDESSKRGLRVAFLAAVGVALFFAVSFVEHRSGRHKRRFRLGR